MLFAKPENSNSNYAKLHDVTNNIIYEQKNELNTMIWLKTEAINLGNGKSQNVPIILPKGFKIKRVGAKVLIALDNGIKSLTMGITNKAVDGLMSNIPTSVSSVMLYNELNQNIPLSSDEGITLYSDNDFDNIGSIEVSVELTLETTN